MCFHDFFSLSQILPWKHCTIPPPILYLLTDVAVYAQQTAGVSHALLLSLPVPTTVIYQGLLADTVHKKQLS